MASSLNIPVKVMKKTTVRIGAARRRIIPKKIRTWLAPSIRADSSISTGMVSKNPFMQFAVKGAKAGDKIAVTWKDNKGDTRTDEATVS